MGVLEGFFDNTIPESGILLIYRVFPGSVAKGSSVKICA